MISKQQPIGGLTEQLSTPEISTEMTEVRSPKMLHLLRTLITSYWQFNYDSVNMKLKEITAKTNIGFVEQSNIGYEHLNFGGLHLNKRGDGGLALNFIRYIRN